MMSRTFGAAFGGTMRGAHHGFECRASSLITPPKVGSGAGKLPAVDGGGGVGCTGDAGGFERAGLRCRDGGYPEQKQCAPEQGLHLAIHGVSPFWL